ncbi:hypothetical protein [Rathayibacter sp. Leaf296]|uniref:hypothetical protein n=1 Tax=Rathayibacter sp. Leaf296 TaxID=1736327 RepID=UPI0007026F0F|nr:hypothetical protein [Rathayibacter sp. Leaf296]KQQ07570.1 hypothetical protein ASF46_18195 [Rathayibacter sp. Leaf296]
MRAPAVLLQGIDVGDTSYWSWEWRGGTAPSGLHAIPLERLLPALDELADALPGVRPRESALDVAALRRSLQHVDAGRRGREADVLRATTDLRMPLAERNAREAATLRIHAAMHRCLTGALSRLGTESELMSRLAEVLLPADLLAQIVAARGPASTPVEVAVLPAQSCARVPWELLRIGRDDDTRLLEVARLSTLSPVLTRDGEHRRRPCRDGGPARVIDPRNDRGMIVHPETRSEWPPGGEELAFQRTVDRAWLAEHLPRASHFTYFGHVASGRDHAGRPEAAQTALVLGTATGARGHLFTAQDALLGTIGSRGPDLGRAPGAGRDLWPMPPRVAVIACESGVDYLDVEPFGLVTAFLELGAEAVTATRWVLHTDRAIGCYEETSAPLGRTALEIDDLQHVTRHPDLLAAMSAWKRTRLDLWREDPSLDTSPLTWGAFTLYSAGTGARGSGEA